MAEWDDIKFFIEDEFRCQCTQCGGHENMHATFMRYLDQFREYLGIPFIITSGYRCPLHPVERRKTSPGPHSTGMAADIAIMGMSAHTLVYALGEFRKETGIQFNGVGLDQRGDVDDRYIHLDICQEGPNRLRPSIWTY